MVAIQTVAVEVGANSSTQTGKYTAGMACSSPMKKRKVSSIVLDDERPKSSVAPVFRASVICVQRRGDALERSGPTARDPMAMPS